MSVAAHTWGKKGVTAKQRQAAARAARLDPLPADEYNRQQSLIEGGTSSAINSRRNSMDPLAEQQFVRKHLGTEPQYPPGMNEEADMAPNSPLLSQQAYQQRSVQSFWSNSAIPPPSFDSAADTTSTQPLSTKSQMRHISRQARTKQRLTDFNTDGTIPPDQTGQVAEVMQQIKAKDASTVPTIASPSAEHIDSPDEESADVQSRPESAGKKPLSLDVTKGPEEKEISTPRPVEAAVPLPSAAPMASEPGCCSCCPCLDSMSSFSCMRYFDEAFGFIGGRGKDAAMSDMRQGVVLPQDAIHTNTHAVESVLAKFPPASVVNIRTRKTDELTAHEAISHPMVKVHILDLRNGSYWKKKDKMRHAVTPYENLRHTGSTGTKGEKDEAGESNAIETILPIMTMPYKLKSHGSFTPVWDENLLINEPVRGILDPYCMMFFELLDFGPGVDLNLYPTGYFPVAWAFLKPLNVRGEPNVGVNLRLQLYKYTNLGRDLEHRGFFGALSSLAGDSSRAAFTKAGVPQVYYEWIWQKHTGRVRYPSTFYMDFIGVAPPIHEKIKGARPLLPTQIEEGRLDYQELLSTVSPLDDFMAANGVDVQGRKNRKAAVEQMSAIQKSAIIRRRKLAEECLLPNNLVHEISVGLTGCFCLRYSPDGRTLAAACGDGLMFTIKLYDSDSGVQLFTYVGHHDLIYDLSWNALGTEIVTASSDNTAKVWLVDATRSLPAHQQRPQAIATLQHTSYVYTAVFHPKLAEKDVILTGGYDGIIRFWNHTGELLHQIKDHTARINSIIFTPNGTRIFSGDSEGTIKIWEDTNYTRATNTIGSARGDQSARPLITDGSTWASRVRLLHTLANDELRGNDITCIRYHPRPERLVVFCRDNCLYVISLLRYEIRKTLSGIPCQHHALKCTISPDGDKLVAGGEDGSAYFYDLSDGELVKIMDVGFHAPLFDVTWHPTQHAVAFGSFGKDQPIKVYEYNVHNDTRSREEMMEQAERRRGELRLTQGGTREVIPTPAVGVAASASSLPVSSAMGMSSAANTARPILTSARTTMGGQSGRFPASAALSKRDDFDDDSSRSASETDRLTGTANLASSKRVTFN